MTFCENHKLYQVRFFKSL